MTNEAIIIYSNDTEWNHRKGAWKQVGDRVWNHQDEIEYGTDEQIKEISKYMIEQVPNIDDCWVEIVSREYFETSGVPYY